MEIAGASIGREYRRDSGPMKFAGKGESKVAFGDGDFAPTAEKTYFPAEPGLLVPAWKVLLWEPVNAYYLVVDAQSGAVLWRKKHH